MKADTYDELFKDFDKPNFDQKLKIGNKVPVAGNKNNKSSQNNNKQNEGTSGDKFKYNEV